MFQKMFSNKRKGALMLDLDSEGGNCINPFNLGLNSPNKKFEEDIVTRAMIRDVVCRKFYTLES